MEFYEVLKKRRSVREYRPDAVPQESLNRIMEAVSLAPSACNRQPFKFLFVRNPELRAKIAAQYPKDWLAQAPVIVLALGDADAAWHRREGDTIIDTDIGIAMEHVQLAAAAEGLSSCWICAFEKAKVNLAANVQAPWCVYAISPLGYSDAVPAPRPGKTDNELFEVID